MTPSTDQPGGGDPPPAGRRVLLLYGPATYRAAAFGAAAARLGLEVIPVVDTPAALEQRRPRPLAVDFSDPDDAAARVAAYAGAHAIPTILGLDDSATLVAAAANALLGLPHNDPAAALAARDKFVMRERLAAAGVPVPAYQRQPLGADPSALAPAITYPSVIKPLRLSGSRGVIRVDDPASFVAAWRRTRRLLLAAGADPAADHLLIEAFIPGVEIALEGLLTEGSLRTLAIFDKPDPLDGPFFEETIYVTPSRLSRTTQAAITATATAAARALGLRHGPVHAELRINEHGVWVIELAGRSIGGLCSSVLEFGLGVRLEEVILRHAAGLPLPPLARTGTGTGAGVMMIPIPSGGMLRSVHGRADALAVPGVTGLDITAPLNQLITPLPEGASYLGFIFAQGESPAAAEAALREAHARLRFVIEPTIMLAPAD
ncbi:MAG: ATP-grasp domain-containing protein [Chloroflexia bacterium]|nr:ATP-grasp domain-containing protein [Chloroflexia bacterium]